MAFWKMAGFEVTPTMPSSIMACRPPFLVSSRDSSSTQGACPNSRIFPKRSFTSASSLWSPRRGRLRGPSRQSTPARTDGSCPPSSLPRTQSGQTRLTLPLGQRLHSGRRSHHEKTLEDRGGREARRDDAEDGAPLREDRAPARGRTFGVRLPPLLRGRPAAAEPREEAAVPRAHPAAGALGARRRRRWDFPEVYPGGAPNPGRSGDGASRGAPAADRRGALPRRPGDERSFPLLRAGHGPARGAPLGGEQVGTRAGQEALVAARRFRVARGLRGGERGTLPLLRRASGGVQGARRGGRADRGARGQAGGGPRSREGGARALVLPPEVPAAGGLCAPLVGIAGSGGANARGFDDVRALPGAAARHGPALRARGGRRRRNPGWVRPAGTRASGIFWPSPGRTGRPSPARWRWGCSGPWRRWPSHYSWVPS